MKIIVTNVTGSQALLATLKDSGVIEYDNGEISHVLFEKSFQKIITTYKEPEQAIIATTVRSKEGQKAAIKRK